MEILNVELGNRSYPIYIGQDLLQKPELLIPHIHGDSALIVSNETVAPLYLQQVSAHLSKIRHGNSILPDGEKYKNLDELNQVFSDLLEQRQNRQTTLIALGGGVVGDMTGFAAASYQRGVAFIQIPTTLLAQVDSSVGGKTGVNHALGKNMIGAFHQPQCVIIDTDTLDTLEDRQLYAGLAEIIKYGLIIDAEFFAWLEDNLDALLARDKTALAYAIRRSCEIKANVVAADELEKGQRALLNFGHTFGHAIETATGYGSWLHGEAVGCGMLLAAELSTQMGWLAPEDLQRTRRLIERSHLPINPPTDMSVNQFLELMAVDKKVLDGQLRLVLLKSIGKAVVNTDFSTEKLKRCLQQATRAA